MRLLCAAKPSHGRYWTFSRHVRLCFGLSSTYYDYYDNLHCKANSSRGQCSKPYCDFLVDTMRSRNSPLYLILVTIAMHDGRLCAAIRLYALQSTSSTLQRQPFKLAK
eukprot:204977-Pleurochrysis_carterae.AAC.1